MSEPPQNFRTTLTGGIQDVSALLPLLGTDQCEHHVGSALERGFLYAAAAPLSLFGSLGIVKIGISVLISSISIPKISISYRKFSINFSQDRWLGARTLFNAGFKLVGTVAPLIAMDGTRYNAETRLVQILDEKHIDNPNNLSVKWKSREWNVALVAFTMFAAVISGTPYIALLLKNPQPSAVHTPWIFPLLRTVGSCLAAVCCQFLIQSRVISLMKNRIVFMTMNHLLIDDLKSQNGDIKPELDLRREEHLRWDVDLPSEQCLWSLEHWQFLSSKSSFTQPNDGPGKPEAHASVTMKTLSFSDPEHIRCKLQELRDEHFPTPVFDRTFVLISWIILCLSLPATVAGYIGCFTLVSASQENGPLIWLGVEAALSIVRILVWSWNPSFDKKTDITIEVKLTGDQPFVTTEKDVRVIESTGNNTLALIPERRFLEWITPHTGPLEQFQRYESLFLYFTLTAHRIEQKCLLYMTIFDSNKRIAVTLIQEKGIMKYIDAAITCNHIASELEATLQATIGEEHPWRTNDDVLFDRLANYYKTIIHALNWTHLHSPVLNHLQPYPMATLPWKWNLLPKRAESDHQSLDQALELPPLTEHNELYLCRGDEHHRKTELIQNWSIWIVENMRDMRSDARNDCHHALADPASNEAKWELTELDSQLAWEWTRREVSLAVSSITLEGVLHRRMEDCIDKVAKGWGNQRLKEWMWSEFVIGQRKRLKEENWQRKERMEGEMRAASEWAEREGRLWREQGQFNPQCQWEAGMRFIDEKWAAGIEGGHSALENVEFDLKKLAKGNAPWGFNDDSMKTSVEQARKRFKRCRWHPQRQNERCLMDSIIKRLNDADSEQDYQYPNPDPQVTRNFVKLASLQLQSQVCAALVYDVGGCDKQAIHDVIKKSTTRSVIRVDLSLLDSIPENDHLLYIGTSSGIELAFIQRNRERWWNEQMGNSSTFYFSPQALGGRYVLSWRGIIAHIFVFLITPSRLRLHLLHSRRRTNTSVSIQENGKEIRRIPTNEIPEELQLKDFELDQFEPGRHELELVVVGSAYRLRDIIIEFFNDPPPQSTVDRTEYYNATENDVPL